MARKAKELRLTVVFTESIDGGYVGYVKELPGCATQGETIGELQANMQDLVPAFIEAMVREFQRNQPPQATVGKVVKEKTYRVRLPEIVPA